MNLLPPSTYNYKNRATKATKDTNQEEAVAAETMAVVETVNVVGATSAGPAQFELSPQDNPLLDNEGTKRSNL